MRRGKLLWAGGLAAALLVALVGLAGHRRAATRRPRTVEEVARAAAARSLYCRSDREDGEVHSRLVVSRTPLTLDEANLLPFGDPASPRWRGKVVVCHPWKQYAYHLEPGCAAVWGEMLLFG